MSDFKLGKNEVLINGIEPDFKITPPQIIDDKSRDFEGLEITYRFRDGKFHHIHMRMADKPPTIIEAFNAVSHKWWDDAGGKENRSIRQYPQGRNRI